MATKEHKRRARGLIEALETRVHAGPPVRHAELTSAWEFLRQNDFSPASDYFNRLGQIQARLHGRSTEVPVTPVKRNYGGEAGGQYMQVQSIYDHVILSTCYEGEFNLKQGRIKLSHRFNHQGRIDFVELKFLRSLEPCLNGEIRKIVLVKKYQELRKDWLAAEAFVLPILPRELIFLYPDIFRCPRAEVLPWLINIGHRTVASMEESLAAGTTNGYHSGANPDQLCLSALRSDEIAWPILQKVASLESAVELRDTRTVVVRYLKT